MRALAAIAVLVAAACDHDAATTAPPRPPPKVETASAQRALHDCRDACEQNAIVTHAPDATLEACRAGCDARFGAGAAAAPPHEVPSRITRSPPVHAPPLVRPR